MIQTIEKNGDSKALKALILPEAKRLSQPAVPKSSVEEVSKPFTDSGDNSGVFERMSAARAETSGADAEVPLKSPYEFLSFVVRILTPGATRSTEEPKLEKPARLSF